MGPDPTPKSREPDALFRADSVNLTFRAEKDGKVRVTKLGWDDAKVVEPGRVFELRWGKQGVEARIVAKVQEPEPDVDPFWIPDAPPTQTTEEPAPAAVSFATIPPDIAGHLRIIDVALGSRIAGMGTEDKLALGLSRTHATILHEFLSATLDQLGATSAEPQEEKPDDAGARAEPASTGGASEVAAG